MDSKDIDWKPRRVLVGYDGSEGAKDAVSLAKTLCAASGAEFLLVNALPFPGPPPAAGEDRRQDEDDPGERPDPVRGARTIAPSASPKRLIAVRKSGVLTGDHKDPEDPDRELGEVDPGEADRQGMEVVFVAGAQVAQRDSKTMQARTAIPTARFGPSLRPERGRLP